MDSLDHGTTPAGGSRVDGIGRTKFVAVFGDASYRCYQGTCPKDTMVLEIDKPAATFYAYPWG